MPEMPYLDLSRLSQSSRSAVAWAALVAGRRVNAAPNQASSKRPSPQEPVQAADLLAGILWAHPTDAEPLALLRHYGVGIEHLFEALGTRPEPPSSAAPELSAMPPLDTDALTSMSLSADLALKFNPQERGLVRIADLFGGLLTKPGPARDLLQRLVGESTPPLDQVAAAYGDYLGPEYGARDLARFLRERFPREGSAEASSAARGEASALLGGPTIPDYSADTALRVGDPREGVADLVGIGDEVDALAYLIANKNLQPPLAVGLFGDWGSGKSFFMQALRHRIFKITQDARAATQPQRDMAVYQSIVQIEFNAWHYVEGDLWASLVEYILDNLQTDQEDHPTLLQERQAYWIQQIEGHRRNQEAIRARRIATEQERERARAAVVELQRQRDTQRAEYHALKGAELERVISEADKARARALLRDAGATRAARSAADLLDAVESLRAQWQRGRPLVTALRLRGGRWLVWLAVLLLAGPAVSALLSYLSGRQFPDLANALASVSVVLGGLTGLVRGIVLWVSGALDRVDQAQAILDEGWQKVDERFKARLGAAQQAYAQAQADYEAAQRAEEALAAEVSALEDKLQHLTPGRVLRDFVVQRATSDDYRKHLGLPALIRRDFERLSEAIRTQNDDLLKRDTPLAEDERKCLINRIVLYIDDLDRCPPQRVVDVLQAVHLLLAFPLFVVVVAVDTRWLMQSLEKHYENLLAESERTGEATPQDYLEKIFQVPLRVRPLTDSACWSIVQGVAASSLEDAPQGPSHANVTPGRVAATPGTPDVGPSVPTPAGGTSPAEALGAAAPRPAEANAQTDLNPEGLKLLPCELGFMHTISPLLGRTPRAVKRFVNVYRLLKAMALRSTPSFASEADQAPYQCVQFLLAVLTGLPALSVRFFRRIDETADLGSLADRLHQELADPPADAQVLEELERLERWLAAQPWRRVATARLRPWARQVARFSFRMEEM